MRRRKKRLFLVKTRHYSPDLGRDVRFWLFVLAVDATSARKQVRERGIPNGGRLFRIDEVKGPK